ncbi:growth arrest and DNA damage-inducible proteins-interacting protein 1 [Pristis pectinata]|uniref:growth arrest and DNA damage-inducible proteins-interacting protein 1 n=1 Tax=Pristis pectinata TaxID=685728 RepID=UPI00223DFB16|nr:growth arrest and DNA damage-inducible proteins-interacting protein 1 [Pristis pectinata]
MAAPVGRRLCGLVGRWSLGVASGARPPPPALRTAAAAYHARPLGLDLSGQYVAGPDAPEWQRGPRAERRRFAAAGAASGVPAAALWPGPGELSLLRDRERGEPGLQQMWSSVRDREAERRQRERYRQKLIAANMAKMPKMVEEWRREKREAKVKQREEKAKRERLLAEARERFGYSIDPRNSKFQEMVKELEKEEKKQQKLMKRRQRAVSRTEAEAAAATS